MNAAHNKKNMSLPPTHHHHLLFLSFVLLQQNMEKYYNLIWSRLHSLNLTITHFYALFLINRREIERTILTLMGFHVTLTFSYLNINQACFGTII